MTKNLLIEKYIEAVRLQGGINTKLPVTLTGTSANLTVGGNLTVTGTRSGGLSTVTDVTASTLAPTTAQSGTTFLLDRAAGVTVTLPAPTVGTTYTFVVVTTVTSNSYKIITDAGTTFMQGTILASSDNLASKSFLGNGTSHVAVTQAAASSNATGGILGSVLEVKCVTSTLWQVWGTIVASATPTTPWATS